MGKSIEAIIKELAEEKVVEDIIRNMKISVNEDKENLEDLAQDIYMDLMEKDAEKIEGLYERNELRYYISRIVVNNIHSKNSPYYVKYKKNNFEGYDKYEIYAGL